MTSTSTSPRRAQLVERRSRVFEMRRAGASFEQIARRIADDYGMPNYTRAEAYRDFNAIIKQFIAEPVEEYRRIEVDRLNTLQMAVWPKAVRGELDAIDSFLKIQTQRAKFEGTFAPTKLAGPDGGPIQVQAIAQRTVAAVVAVVDRLELSPERRAAVLDEISASFAIEGTVVEEEGA